MTLNTDYVNKNRNKQRETWWIMYSVYITVKIGWWSVWEIVWI